MFKRIHWLSFIPLFLIFIVAGTYTANFILRWGEPVPVLDFFLPLIFDVIAFFIARGISRAIYDKVERRRYFKKHPEEDHHNK